jgi:hypothetical protein
MSHARCAARRGHKWGFIKKFLLPSEAPTHFASKQLRKSAPAAQRGGTYRGEVRGGALWRDDDKFFGNFALTSVRQMLAARGTIAQDFPKFPILKKSSQRAEPS